MCPPHETALLYLAAALPDPRPNTAGQSCWVSQAPLSWGATPAAPEAAIMLSGRPILHPHVHTPAPLPMCWDAHRAPRPGLLAGRPVPRVTGWGGKMFGEPAAIQLLMVVFEELPYRPFVKALASPP